MWDEDKYQESRKPVNVKINELIYYYALKRNEARNAMEEIRSCAPSHHLIAQNNLLSHVYQEMIDNLEKLLDVKHEG